MKENSNTVRIISGDFKGRVIKTPGGKTHPMGSRERIALFNMIGEYLPGSSVLDAFAGSGALGIEAISRGASFVVFIDNDRRACNVISENLQTLSIGTDRSRVTRCDIYRSPAITAEKFKVIIADPPYDEYDGGKLQSLVRLVADPDGVLVLSHPGEAPEFEGLTLKRTHHYARANISLYHREGFRGESRQNEASAAQANALE